MSNATQENCRNHPDTRQVRPNEGHAVWCDPALHAQVAAEAAGGPAGCVGPAIYTTAGGRDIGGWWRQAGADKPRFAAEWDGRFPDLPVGEMLSLYKLFVTMSWKDVGNVAAMLGDAIDAYEGGDSWRDSIDGWGASRTPRRA